jgi:hypothetical protein
MHGRHFKCMAHSRTNFGHHRGSPKLFEFARPHCPHRHRKRDIPYVRTTFRRCTQRSPTTGDPGLTLVEAQTEFSVWCILPAPLYTTNDVRERDLDVEAILLNPEAIAINQDVLGLAATQLNASVPNQMQFVKKLANGDIAVVVMNYDDTMTQKGTELVFADFLPSPTMQYSVRDIARRVNDGFDCTKVTLGDLAPHESAFLRFTLTNKTC